MQRHVTKSHASLNVGKEQSSPRRHEETLKILTKLVWSNLSKTKTTAHNS